MSKKTKRIAKGLGATALAVATIASGLSFGAASASAVTTGATTAKTVQFYWKNAANDYQFAQYATHVINPGTSYELTVDYMTPSGQYTTLSAVQKAAPKYTVVPLDDGAFELRAPNGRCLVGAPGGEHPFWQCGTIYTVLNQDDSGSIYHLSEGGQRIYTSTESSVWVGGGGVTTFKASTTPGGNWLGIPSNLGSSYAALTATGTFVTDLGTKATVSGTAEPGAAITLKNGTTTVASTTADANGDYSVAITAPNKGGSLDLTVSQTVDGSVAGTADVSLDYGTAVSITGPADQEDVPAGSTAITGAGEPGSTVQVFDNDGRNPIVSTTVRSNGTWSAAANLTAGEHELEAKQMSKGANTTTSTVTVNPGQADVEFTAAGRFDADDATKPAVAHGSAPAGSTVILRNSVGTEIGRTTAGADDTYEITIDPARATSGVNSFSAIVQGDEGNAKSFTLDYGTPAAPVVVTTPAANGTVEPGTVRFAGTGQAGSKIVVRGSVRQVATATVNAQGAWSANSTMELAKGAYNLYFDQTSKGGLKSTVQHRFDIGEAAPVVTPPTVTSPGSGDVLDTLTPQFRGTGHEGATITVRGSSRVVATGTVQNGHWVANTSAASPLAPGTYNLYVDQSIRGTVTSTIRIAFTVSNESFRELTLSAPAQNENVTTLRPTFVGTATPGAEIRVGSSRTTVATATVAADGTWRATAGFDLARGGTYAGLEVKQTLASGKTSTVSASFTVDRNAQ